jgi:DNA replication protein
MRFTGFPARMEFTPVPNLFINRLAPGMDGLELKVMLCIFNILFNKKGRPRFISEAELLENPSVLASLSERGDKPRAVLGEVLGAAAAQGILVPLEMVQDANQAVLYFLNSPADLADRAGLESGQVKTGRLEAAKQPDDAGGPPPDVFSLYEDNIGLLTPMIAEELKDALKTYPEEWVGEAMKEAAALNKRSWRYIARILERWATEGKNNGAHRPNNKEENPGRFFQGRFGPLIQR